MRLGSLCTGIGGLDLAAEAHFGAETIWCAEYEPHLDPLLQRHFGPVLNLQDLTTVSWDELEPVDVLTAGYPCQPFSHAGKRKGSSDVRHLWPHIAEAVRVLRPRWVVLENVAGHLSLGFGDVLRDLAEAGFDAEWCLLRASDVGAPHQRARIFIVATDADQLTAGWHSGAAPCSQEPHGRWGDAHLDHRPSHEDRNASTDPGGERHGGGQDGGAVGRVDRGDAGQARQRERAWPVAGDRSHAAVADADGHPGTQPDLGAQQPGLAAPRRSDAQRLGQAPADASGMGWGPGTGLRPDEPAGLGRGRPRDDARPTEWGPYAPAIRRWELVLGRPAPAPTDDRGRLAPAFVEWMMGYPAGWVTGMVLPDTDPRPSHLSRTQALKALGNAVVPQQGYAALCELVPLEALEATA